MSNISPKPLSWRSVTAASSRLSARTCSALSPEYRKRFEDYTVRIYELFSNTIHDQFPSLSEEECYRKALYLYSGLVGTMSMARTMSDHTLAFQVLAY